MTDIKEIIYLIHLVKGSKNTVTIIYVHLSLTLSVFLMIKLIIHSKINYFYNIMIFEQHTYIQRNIRYLVNIYNKRFL